MSEKLTLDILKDAVELLEEYRLLYLGGMDFHVSLDERARVFCETVRKRLDG